MNASTLRPMPMFELECDVLRWSWSSSELTMPMVGQPDVAEGAKPGVTSSCSSFDDATVLKDVEARGMAAIKKFFPSSIGRSSSSSLSERTTPESRGRNFFGSGSRLSRFCFFLGLGVQPRCKLIANDEEAGPLPKNRSTSSSEESDSIRLRALAGAGDDVVGGGERLSQADESPPPA